jgi:hypothetical protein
MILTTCTICIKCFGFCRFGANVKIVHFIGPDKPWLMYFDSSTGTVRAPFGQEHLHVSKNLIIKSPIYIKMPINLNRSFFSHGGTFSEQMSTINYLRKWYALHTSFKPFFTHQHNKHFLKPNKSVD